MITRADCPSKIADPYPGKRNKNNPSGSLLTRKEYVEKQVQDWIDHFKDNEQYQDELVTNKVRYLVRHLKVFNMTYKAALKLLVELESRLTVTDAEDISVGQDEIMDEGTEVEHSSQVEGNEHDQNENNVDMFDDGNSSDIDMFADDETCYRDNKRAETDLELAKLLAKTDTELFDQGLDVSEKVERSKKFIERKRKYAERCIEGLSSQEVLQTYSQNPVFVQESTAMKERLKHLAKRDKANRTIHKSLQETIDVLQRTPGAEARNQVKVIAAASFHHRWGSPDFPEVSWRAADDAKKMKLDLMQGTVAVLTPPTKAKKRIYPKQLEDLATKHWNENTILEPALHRRKAESDDRETIPTRYQSLTDKEQYSLFKEDCGEEMADILRSFSIQEIEKLRLRPESNDKTRRLAYFETLPDKVPSIEWYLRLKPPQVKPLHDHTTALCKICEKNLLNYSTLFKAIKLQCKCKSASCPNWMCLCSEDEDDEEEGSCNCGCDCDECKMCKVGKA